MFIKTSFNYRGKRTHFQGKQTQCKQPQDKCVVRVNGPDTPQTDVVVSLIRYHKLPIANRICGLCKTEVGDEIHFMLQCATLNKTRSNFIKDISDKFPNFSKLDTKSQFIWLMSSEDKILIQKVSSLLHSLNEERNDILNK